MTDIQKELFKLRDPEYAAFQVKLTPGITLDTCIGVRLPLMRKLAKEIKDSREAKEFLCTLPHQYYDENMLHSMLLSSVKDYDLCVRLVDEFLPYVDNWAVCDTLIPKVFIKNRDKLAVKILQWTESKETYTCRFGIRMIMNHFLDEDFDEKYLEIPASIISDEYYINMMIAWFFATALCKQWEPSVKYLENRRLPVWVHNKTIQKAVESYRITDSQKAYLKTLRTRGRG